MKLIKASLLIILCNFVSMTLAAEYSFEQHLINIIHSTQLNPNVVRLALSGYRYATAHATIKKPILTIVDYSQPSVAKRLYVIDLKTDQLLMNSWVAHGRNSGELMSLHFSNTPDSKQSSIGVFVTENTYFGKHGKSMVINGLEKNINDNAKSRGLVVHSAGYVSPAFYQAYGRMGRSFGCLAVSPTDLNRLLNLTENGTVIFSYAPQEINDLALR